MAERAAIYRTRGLAKSHGSGPGTVHALRGVDLTVHEGEMVVLLGGLEAGQQVILHPGEKVAQGVRVRPVR